MRVHVVSVLLCQARVFVVCGSMSVPRKCLCIHL